jgi:3',5'-cyclic AMP phosphodiesterase CpdA
MAATDRALDHALKLFGDSDFIVITGDLANWGERQAYVRLKERLAGIDKPVFLMVGNHDNRENFFSVFGDRHPFEMPYAHYVQNFGDYQLLFLDSQTPLTHGGAFSPDRLAWIDRKLAAADRACRWYGEPHYAVVLVEPNALITHIQEFNYTGPYLVRDRQNFEEFIALCADRGVKVPREDPAAHAAE